MPDAPIVLPYIPQTITVHLGSPDSPAKNVTVPFTEYIKNVASSEVYPTWDERALRANILAIISYALNRIYTEYYRSRGYDFDITNSTAIDQSFVEGRSYFENISRLVDELFDSYIRRVGFVEPLAAKFCNGTTTTCEGLSQWGSEELARQGLNSVEILRYYYGDDIEIVPNAPISNITQSYPGTPLQIGSTGPYVTSIQSALNRISQNYPAIPKIPLVDGIFGTSTENAVRAFQRIFSLSADGIVGPATWYQIVRIYVAILRLAELRSQGQTQYFISAYPQDLSLGDSSDAVRYLQYMLEVLASFDPDIPSVSQSGVYDTTTRDAVQAFQRSEQLPVTGAVDAATWDAIYTRFSAIEQTVFDRDALFDAEDENTDTAQLQQSPGSTLQPGTADGG